MNTTAMKPVTVETEPVRAGLLRDMATFSGQLSAENSVMVKSETDGVIAEILFEEGQEVEEGDRVGTAGEGNQHPPTDQIGEGRQEVICESREGHAPS